MQLTDVNMLFKGPHHYESYHRDGKRGGSEKKVVYDMLVRSLILYCMFVVFVLLLFIVCLFSHRKTLKLKIKKRLNF